MLNLCAAALAAACLVTPAVAGDACTDPAKLIAAVPTTSGKVLVDFRVKLNPLYDREIIVGFADGAQSLWFFARGCLIGPPAVLGPVVDAPEPSAVPAAPPAPHGGGLEIGS